MAKKISDYANKSGVASDKFLVEQADGSYRYVLGSDFIGVGGASQLSDLSDVNSATATNRFALMANGSAYVGRALVEADISDLGSYLTAETNDLTAAVTWANVPNANITESSVTQHQAALSITVSQVSDVTATAAELNVLDLSETALTAGWVYAADGASSASWRKLLTSELTNDSGFSTHAAVTLAGQDYLTLSGQEITANQIQEDDINPGNPGEQLTTNEAGTALEYSLASKYLQVRKGSAGTIAAGKPVYISGYNVGGWIEVEEADASSSATMPAVGLTFDSISISSTDRVLISGNFVDIDTNSWDVGDSVYVSETTGTLTNVKPVGAAFIQKVGTVGRKNAVNGQLVVTGAGRSNDIPNFTAADKYWYGGTDGVSTEGDITTAGRALLDDADAAAQLITLGVNATASELNILDLSATSLTTGWVYAADGVSSASWRKLLGSEITNDSGWAAGDALTSGTLAQFATTSSAQLAGVLNDETGSGLAVFNNSPTITSPRLTLEQSNNPSPTADGEIWWDTNSDVLVIGNGSGQTTIGGGGGDALTTNPLSQFAATTSAQLAGVINDETGSGLLVFATSPTLTTPLLGIPTSGTLTNCDGYPGDSSLVTVGTITSGTWNGTAIEGTAIASTGEVGGSKFLREDGDGTCSWVAIPGGGDALVANPLSQFAATTSAQLAGVINDETGSGLLVFATSPTLITPILGTPTSGTLTNCTGYVGDSSLVTTGALNSGSITSGFGNIDIGASTFDTTGAVNTGDLTATGTVTASVEYLFTERADHNFTPAATRGILWVKNVAPNELYYTDDDGTDWLLNQAAGAGDMILASNQAVTGEKIFDASTLGLNDTDSAFDLFLGSTSTLTADRILTFDVNDAARTLTISGDATISGTNTGNETKSSIDALLITDVGALNAGSITTGFGNIDNGASTITTTGDITGGGIHVTGDTSAGDSAALGYTATEGLILTGQGSTNDLTFKNDADASVMHVLTGTTNLSMDGNIDMNGQDITDVHEIQLDGTPDTDHTGNGFTTNTFNAGATIAAMDLVYLDSTPDWNLTDADAEATADGMLALALEAGTATNPMNVLLQGFARDASWTWTIGGKVYLDTVTAGGLTQTAPTGTGDVVRIVGYAVSATEIYFDPDKTYITV